MDVLSVITNNDDEIDVNGTKRCGTIASTFSELNEVFGDPIIAECDPEWILKVIDSNGSENIVTIYTDGRHGVNTERWVVGGKRGLDDVCDVLDIIKACNNISTKSSGKYLKQMMLRFKEHLSALSKTCDEESANTYDQIIFSLRVIPKHPSLKALTSLQINKFCKDKGMRIFSPLRSR